MPLEKIQKILALIYTDKNFREAFFTDMEKTVAEYQLNDAEIRQLSELSVSRINFFTDTLKHKRLHQMYKFLPVLHKMLGRDFINLFTDYADTYIPSGIKKYYDDAFNFAYFLKNSKAEAILKYPWLSTLADYEIVMLKAGNPDKRLIICKFRYPVDKIIQQLNSSENISVSPKLNIALWLRYQKAGKWLKLKIL